MSTLIIARCPAPITGDGRLASPEVARPVLYERIDALDEATLTGIMEEFCFESEDRDEARQLMRAAADDVLDDSPFIRDRILDLDATGRLFYESGGMSGGDMPTEAAGNFDIVAKAGITDEPVDGGVFIPPLFRLALEAFASEYDIDATGERFARALGIAAEIHASNPYTV
jgi:hypothetical protein